MITPRIAGGWQTTMADLALILFIVSVAGLNANKAGDAASDLRPSPRGEAAAVYRAGADAPPLDTWLAEQAPDPRQHLTIVARYGPGEAELAAARALALAAQAGDKGRSARILLERGESGEAVAILAFDDPSPEVAQTLQGVGQD